MNAANLIKSSASGGATADNTVIYTSGEIWAYNCHYIENTSATDPCDVYVSFDGTNYCAAAVAAEKLNDVTTGGGVKVITIPKGTIGRIVGRFVKLKVLKDGATVETPSIRYMHCNI